MLRLTHTQAAQGGLLVSDIDDGLPHRTAKHGTGDPKKFERDGNAPSGADTSTKPDVNFLKQKCYIPRRKLTDTTVAGYIDVAETDRVLMSQAKGVINGLRVAGQLTVTSFLPSDVVAPVVAPGGADLGAPGPGDLTITGTGLTSLSPDITTVYITGTVSFTYTQLQITTGGGTVGATSIVIPAAMLAGAVITTTFAQVKADNLLSAVVALT